MKMNVIKQKDSYVSVLDPISEKWDKLGHINNHGGSIAVAVEARLFHCPF